MACAGVTVWEVGLPALTPNSPWGHGATLLGVDLLHGCFWCLLRDLPPWLWAAILGASVLGAAVVAAGGGVLAVTAAAVGAGATVLGAHSLARSAGNFHTAYDRYQQTGDWNAAREAWRSGVETAYQVWADKQPIQPPPFTPGTDMDTADAPPGPLTVWRNRFEKYSGL